MTHSTLIMAAWAFVFVIVFGVTMTAPLEVHWGSRFSAGPVPMSRRSRLVFITVPGLMFGAILSGVSGFGHTPLFSAAFLLASAATFISAWIDTRKWKHEAETKRESADEK